MESGSLTLKGSGTVKVPDNASGVVVAKDAAVTMALCLAACGDNNDQPAGSSASGSGSASGNSVKVGFICLHDENSTYDLNFINGAKEACEALGITDYIIKTNIKEDQECQQAAEELVDAGCNIIFADSFGHEDYMIQVAKDNPEVQFCHSTGTKAHTENLPNYHNAWMAYS